MSGAGRQHLLGTSGQTLAHVGSPLQTLARRRRPDVRARPARGQLYAPDVRGEAGTPP